VADLGDSADCNACDEPDSASFKHVLCRSRIEGTFIPVLA